MSKRFPTPPSKKRPPVPVDVTASGSLRTSPAVAAFGADRLYDLVEQEGAAWRRSSGEEPPRKPRP